MSYFYICKMNLNRSIQFKAALLLFVFSMNMIVGFVCAIGMDMRFNGNHHPNKELIQVHTHANGKKHEHHNKIDQHHQEKKNTGIKQKEGCCNDVVLKISQTEKAVPQNNIIVNPTFFIAFVCSYYNFDILSSAQIAVNLKYFLQNYHPPIADIRIAIRSFQI